MRAFHQQPRVTLTELTYQCGYYDQAHFSNDFKSLVGISPCDYFTRQPDLLAMFQPDLLMAAFRAWG